MAIQSAPAGPSNLWCVAWLDCGGADLAETTVEGKDWNAVNAHLDGEQLPPL